MLQRVAYSIYWMSRYLQRADCYARLLTAQITLANNKNIPNQWHQILIALADDASFYKKYEKTALLDVLNHLTFDDENANSIVNVLTSARNNARSIRETIHQDNWEILNIFYLKTKEYQSNPNKNIAFYQLFFDEMNTFHTALSNEIYKEAIKKQAVLFFKLGSLIELNDKVSRVLDLGFFEPKINDEDINLAISSSISGQSNRQLFNQKNELIRYFILDENNDYSIKNKLKNIESVINQISVQSVNSQLIITIKIIEYFLGSIFKESVLIVNLNQTLDAFQLKNNALDQAIFEQYFVFKPTHLNLNEGEQ